jgi:hypothetical protein
LKFITVIDDLIFLACRLKPKKRNEKQSTMVVMTLKKKGSGGKSSMVGVIISEQSKSKTANQTDPNRKLYLVFTAHIIFLLNRKVWSGLRVWFAVFISENQTKPHYLT